MRLGLAEWFLFLLKCCTAQSVSTSETIAEKNRVTRLNSRNQSLHLEEVDVDQRRRRCPNLRPRLKFLLGRFPPPLPLIRTPIGRGGMLGGGDFISEST